MVALPHALSGGPDDGADTFPGVPDPHSTATDGDPRSGDEPGGDGPTGDGPTGDGPTGDGPAGDAGSDDLGDQVEAVVGAARIFSAVTAESVAQAGDTVTLPQLRVLTLASTRGSLNNGQVARALGVHISNASRICERLVQGGLLGRRDSPNDRRQVELTITGRGEQLLSTVTDHRRAVFRAVLSAMPPEERAALSRSLGRLTEVAERVLETPHADIP